MPITVPLANQESYLLGGVSIETNVASALVSSTVFLPSGKSFFVFHQGSPSSNAFIPGNRSLDINLTVDNATGVWSTNTGMSGTLTGPQLTSLNTNQRNLRNAVESFSNTTGIVPGVVVAWT